VSQTDSITIIDVTDTHSFDRLPPCADPRFDHRSCDYWEDAVRGSKASRPTWWRHEVRPVKATTQVRPDNPFAPSSSTAPAFNPFDPSTAEGAEAALNPFMPQAATHAPVGDEAPAKLRLLERGRAVFGSYAKVLMVDDEPAAYVQFGPLSAYPRARRVRELYARLPSAPLPAVITCIASTPMARGQGLARRLIEDVVGDLASRGFAAVEAYPDLTLGADEASAANPAFWVACGFKLAAADERFPVMRRELD
jgi:GNAT superfamily N-acetyltransferase